MSQKNLVKKLAIIAAALTGLSAVAHAAPPAAPTPTPKISLSQALEIASSAAKGKATGAELETENGTLVYSVSVTSPTGEEEVLVDSDNGSVISIKPESGNNQNENNQNEGDDGEQADDGPR
jgi:uncharacterized membrane protein YkoI